jgi:hypothetical protein
VVAVLPCDPVSHTARLWRPADLQVIVDPAYCRRANPQIDALIDAEWEARRRAHPTVELFNALKFRLAHVEVAAPAADECAATPPPMTLHLGLTDYKSNVVTNVATASAALDRRDVADALGVEALVITSDDRVVLFRRSARVAECPGFYCCPGGHAEPSRVVAALRAFRTPTVAGMPPPAAPFDAERERITDIVAARDIAAWCRAWCANPVVHSQEPSAEAGVAAPDGVPLANEAVSRTIVDELFFSARDEVADELGLPLSCVHAVGLAGVVRVPRHNMKPDLIFVIRLDGVTAADALAAFEARRNESTMTEADSAAPFLSLSKADAAAAVQRNAGTVRVNGDIVPLTPATVGCIALGLPTDICASQSTPT